IWLDEELEKALRPTKNKAGKLSDETRHALDEARSFFEELSLKADANLATKKDPISYRAARVVGRVARDALSSIEKIQIPQEVSWDSFKVLRDNLSNTARSLRESRNNTQKEIHGLYLLDMLSFSGVVERIAKVGEKISQFLEGGGENLQRAKTLTSIVETIRQIGVQLDEKKKESVELERTREGLSSAIKELSNELEKITSNDSLKQVLEIEKELRKESREFRTDTLTHLRRPDLQESLSGKENCSQEDRRWEEGRASSHRETSLGRGKDQSTEQALRGTLGSGRIKDQGIPLTRRSDRTSTTVEIGS